jgi:hypothetical protein
LTAEPSTDISDDELARLALAASPDPEIGRDALSVWDVLDADADAPLLPEWYQPSAMRRSVLLHGWRRRVVLLTIVAFVAIDAFGLCSTYGHIVFA